MKEEYVHFPQYKYNSPSCILPPPKSPSTNPVIENINKENPMNSFKFHDIRVEKANAVSKYRRIQTITTLLRLIELSVFLIVVSRFSAQFVLPNFKLSGEYFRHISVALISPRFVFLIGNAIVIVLFLKSGGFSGERIDDLYEEYAEKCRRNQEKKPSDDYRSGGGCEDRTICRSKSERMMSGFERRRELRRSVTEKCRSSPVCERKAAAAAAEEMSSEEFRRTVEAFIARQQRFLRED